MTRDTLASLRKAIRHNKDEYARILSMNVRTMESMKNTIESLEREKRELMVHRNASAILESLYMAMANLLADEQLPNLTKKRILDLTYYGKTFSRPLERVKRAKGHE